MNRVKSSNAMYAENTEKRLVESQLKTVKLYRIIRKISLNRMLYPHQNFIPCHFFDPRQNFVYPHDPHYLAHL